MSFQKYIDKVQSWIDQGRLRLPKGSEACVYQDDNGDFYIEVVHTDKDKPPVAKAGSISV